MNNYSSQQKQQMLLLVSWNPNDKFQLQSNTLQQINHFVQGEISMICFEGFQQKRYNLSSLLGKPLTKPPDLDNCILISPTPIFYPKTNKYLYILQILATNDQAKQNLHLLSTLFCNIIVTVITSEEPLMYLSSIDKRVYINNTNHNNSVKTAILICIQVIQNQYSPQFLKQSTEQLYNKFQIYNILNQMVSIYPAIKGFQCPSSSFSNTSSQFREKLMQQLQTLSIYQKSNNEIMYGPILTQYISNICQQYNTKKGNIENLQKLQNDIQIDEGYGAYMEGVKQFHNTSLNLINKNKKLDGNQLQQILNIGKVRAFQQFYSNGGSPNLQYRKMLQDYITKKNRQIISAYSYEQRNTNLQILQNESKQVLDKISKSKLTNKNDIKTYIDQMGKNYQNQANGPQKYSIYNQYIKIFTPIAFQPDQQKQQKQLHQKQKFKQLQQTKMKLQRQSNKGGCCIIM